MDDDMEMAASVEAARQACARERVAFVQSAGGDVIGVSDDGKILRAEMKTPGANEGPVHEKA